MSGLLRRIFCSHLLIPLIILCTENFLPWASGQRIHVREIFSLPNPEWIKDTGMSKGTGHDRQDIGYLLKKHTILRLRQVNPEFTQDLIVRLIGDDTWTDQEAIVNSEWIELCADVDLVPFIDTPSGDINATIEYIIGDLKNPLIVYKRGSNEPEFFSAWDKQNSYILVKNSFFQLLIPPIDKNNTKNLSIYGFNSLDDLIKHYELLFKYYNKLAGLDESSPVDRSSKHRYFLRADKHCENDTIAYYSDLWTAACDTSIEKVWFEATWGHLHEIGHGYQPDFQGMNVDEVTNNIFVVYFNFFTKSRDYYRDKWIKDEDEIPKLDSEIEFYNVVSENKENFNDISDADPVAALAILISLTEEAGKTQAFTKLYKAHRAAVNYNKGTSYENRLAELINRHYSDHSYLDFTPVLESIGLEIDPKESLRNRLREYRPIAALKHVVPEKYLNFTRSHIDRNLLFTTDYELVSNKDISFLNLTGHLKIILKTDRYLKSFCGVKMIIKDGPKLIEEMIVQNSTNYFFFFNIPLGIYSIDFVGQGIRSFKASSNYIYINKNSDINIARVDFKRYFPKGLINQTIIFHGQYSNIAKFTIDFFKKSATFEVLMAEPHSDFLNDLYMYIKVTNPQGDLKFIKSLSGISENVTLDSFSVEINDMIYFYHEQSDNYEFISTDDVGVDKSSKLNVYRMTKYGLQNLAVAKDPQINFGLKVLQFGRFILSDKDYIALPIDLSQEKQAFVNFVFLLEKPYRIPLVPLFEIFCNCSYAETLELVTQKQFKPTRFLSNVAKENSIYAKNVLNTCGVFRYIPQGIRNQTIEFSGPDDNIIAKFTKDFTEDVAVLKIFETDLNTFCSNDVYMYIRVTDIKGIIKFEKNVNAVIINKSTFVFPLTYNDTFEFFHSEIVKVNSKDVDVDLNSKLNKYRVTKYGIQNLVINKDPQLNYAVKLFEMAQSILSDEKLYTLPLEFSDDKQAFIILVLLLEEKPYNHFIPFVENFCNCSYSELYNLLNSKKYLNGTNSDLIRTHLNYAKKNTNVLESMYVPQGLTKQTVTFNGYQEDTFAKFTSDFLQNSATFEILTSTPHLHFKNNLYMYIKVTNLNGTVKYEKLLNGTGTNKTLDIISLEQNDKIHFYHKSIDRIVSDDVDINRHSELNSFTVTKYGLWNMDIDKDPQFRFAFKIFKFGQSILSDEMLNALPTPISHEKQAYIRLVKMLDKYHRKSLLETINKF